MKIRNRDEDGMEIKLEMTPMIDIVFQLLVFFIMLFKIVHPEGDFNIRLPASSKPGPPPPNALPPMTLRMQADDAGKLARMSLATSDADAGAGMSFEQLQTKLREIVNDSNRKTAEISLDCSPGLKYQYVIKAIDAISGYKENGERHELVRKIKFKKRHTRAGPH